MRTRETAEQSRSGPAPAEEGGIAPGRRLAVAVIPLLLAAGLLWLSRGGHLYCLFYELTGLYCPGCGSGRAVLALLHGQPLRALRCNALLFLLGIPCAAVLLREYLRVVFPGLGLQKTVLPAWFGGVSLALVLAFWLLRNLPALAFLAP